jgi:putative intracellular protease/amidase
VSIQATDANAAEQGRDPAVFTITRTGSTARALTVTYALSGTATNGSDYVRLSGRVTIPAGRASTTITVYPNDDRQVESNETLSLALQGNAAYQLGSARSAAATIVDNDRPTAQPLPVLMVIANQDFYYREYSETRQELLRAGVQVRVAAATRSLARPHANSGQGADGGFVMPDLTLAEAQASNYSAIVFVGGWGSSAYQYDFAGTYQNAAYNGSLQTELIVNNLIGDFVRHDKYVTAICHGVSVLAWARINGTSPIAGRTVVAYAGSAPASNVPGSNTTRWHVETNGARMLTSRSVGDPTTATDDVVVDGRIITAENYDSARRFGQIIAQRLTG